LKARMRLPISPS